ncbi:MAG: hypothetical protein BMS9Abin08_1399 [Gammaproteobacteria bacterium]|nr:MAG: hypothetical protein BMS9Abin08_1399 [Gammaproteobacteria bacterium]
MKTLSDIHNMNSKTSLVALGLVLALGAGQEAWAAQQKEEDSVYQWGRWSVLSPAAGGDAYKAALAPDAANNARPGEADEFQPEVASVGTPPIEPPIEPPVDVVESCVAGAACGFATYSRESGGSDGQAAGPVLASFELVSEQITDPNNSGPGGTPFDVTSFSVTDAADPESFPDVDSIGIQGGFSGGTGDIQTTEGNIVALDGATLIATTNLDTSTLSHSNQDTGQEFNFNGVDAGYWRHLAEQRVASLLTDVGTTRTLSDSYGYFVAGVTPTIEQMEAFAAGRVSATYNGVVLNYSSPVELTFNFDNNTFNGDFGTANSFNGFQINGAVDGVNFSAADAGKTVNGSFLNGGFNASGAVNNGSQAGVFSTDLVN